MEVLTAPTHLQAMGATHSCFVRQAVMKLQSAALAVWLVAAQTEVAEVEAEPPLEAALLRKATVRRELVMALVAALLRQQGMGRKEAAAEQVELEERVFLQVRMTDMAAQVGQAEQIQFQMFNMAAAAAVLEVASVALLALAALAAAVMAAD